MEELEIKKEADCDENEIATEGSCIKEKFDTTSEGNGSLNELSKLEGSSVEGNCDTKSEGNESLNKLSKRQLKRLSKKEKWLARLPEKR